MSTTAIRDKLRAISFLDGLTDSAYHQLARLVSLVRYETDEMLFEEGSPRSFLALVVSGAVAIEKQMNSRPIRLVTLGAGEAVGEGLLLDDSKHGTSARALQQTDVLVLRSEKVQDMLKEHPQLYAALIGRAARAISQRLAATDATIVGRGRTLGFGGHHVRVENDLLGTREIPDEALYGVQTLRALENFPITGIALREFPALVEALAAVKEPVAITSISSWT
jgi:aspartate ammonia-lyase